MRIWMLGLCVALVSATAVADDKAKAKQLYDEGLRHYQVAEYKQAIDSWKEAYLISKKPLLLFNIGQAYRLSGDCKTAQTFYDNYTEAEPNPKNQDELDQAIAACKTAPATTDKPAVTSTQNPPLIPVDTHPTDTKPVETKPVETKPVEPTPLPPVAPAPVEASGGHRTLGLIVGIAGVALEGGAVVFALQGKSKANDAEKVSTWNAAAMDLQSAGERDNKLAWGLGIAGGAAIVAGVVLYVTGGASEEHGVAIVPTRNGAQVGWSTSF
jgi:tetratricopeptide (TPR) repeat protein